MRKTVLTALLIILATILVSCGGNSNLKKIGILQYVSHEDLDDAKDGFIEALKVEGFIDGENIKIEVLNPQADATTMQQQSARLVRRSDLILAIGTPAAVSVANEAKSKGSNVPILFTAVTDPVDAKLVKSLTNHGSNISGTTDLTPIGEQIGLINELDIDAKKVGIIYNGSESNSEIQANIAKAAIEELWLKPVIKTINTIGDLKPIFSNLANVEKVDVIFIPSDNLISSNIGTLKEENKAHKLPIIASTTFQVKEGATLTLGLSYKKLGIQTGQMAVKILNGTNIKDLDVEGVNDLDFAVNTSGFVLSKELIDRADLVFGE